ncbi:MAG: sialate O-acetylesterase [Firmicutes bacterium]|jgi:sialate O-acetylesterase|nr:sialate O-acetylesterase [Bacillota bacterium]
MALQKNTPAQKKLELSPLLSDGMVLQRNAPVKIWGRSEPGTQLTVAFCAREYKAETDTAGNWQVVMDPLEPGGPWEMVISCDGEEYRIKNVLVGDVWVLSGQSNMELPVRRTLDLFAEEVREAKNPFIREFAVPMVYDFHRPRAELTGGQWKEVTPENVLDFSAVGYFFAAALYDKYQVPIGLIRSAIGGTPIEAWMSEEALAKAGDPQAFASHREVLAKCRDDGYIQRTIAAETKAVDDWYRRLNAGDEGYKNGELPWAQPSFDDSKWPVFTVPNSWAGSELAGVNGAVWFRKEFTVPGEMAGKEALLRLGAIIDADEAYLNGVLVGQTAYQYPPRKYPVPEGVLQAGKNTLALRVISNRGTGGFVLGKRYALEAGGQAIDLSGPWRYKIGVQMGPTPATTFFQYFPTGLYNGMIAPLHRYVIKGVLWYQGESNTGHPENYRSLLATLVKSWREQWQIGEFPFLYVQLTNFMAAATGPEESNWARLREEQRLALHLLSNAAMAVTIDAGEDNDLHPQDKKTVGHRLALAAQKVAYGEDLVYQGPMFARLEVKDGTAILSFTSTGGGLVAKGGGPLRGFELCGADRKFYRAEAEIRGEQVIVHSSRVKEPFGIRYAWANNPAEANLYNKEGLPASPFEAYLHAEAQAPTV